ncbi:hypothetical protein C7B77_27855 [Chamaesiphon polymorphus CCALA 037]|uniref:Uncharacterized protein n=2 Tax=Chamaesiphon TaxID=217161 RepID=A0A2T1F7I7_9CYAN|nr:hypothetical protein C7B77_27855 [Chamaesiphon polymorphus CCALA 037]
MKVINMQSPNRIAIVSAIVLVSLCSFAMSATAQPTPEVAIDRMFRDESAPGSTRQGRELMGSLKKWMGTYQRTLKTGNGYVAIFDSGSLPIDAKFRANGTVESMTFGCPTSRSLSASEAPMELRKALSKCAGFK